VPATAVAADAGDRRGVARPIKFGVWSPAAQEYLRQWLTDAQARDQFVVRHHDTTAVFYNNKNEEPEPVYSRDHWTETYVQWSPLGTYLTTFHRQGVALWGGQSWKKIVRLAHPGVRWIDYSPKETYCVTWSPEGEKNDDGEVLNLLVWDVRSGKVLRAFPTILPPSGHMTWPAFKWSHDEKYFARVVPDQISVYETPGMGLLEKKSIKIPGVQDFQWSPTDNILAYSTPEVGDVPARVTLMDIPSKTIRRTKNLFNVQDYRLHWHPDGDYFAVKVDRKGKRPFTSFELFRIREKDIPVESLELKDHVIAFAWEPKGDKFVLAHGEQPVPGTGPLPSNVSFYSMEAAKGRDAVVKHLKTLERKPVNFLYWSPKGQFIVLAGLRGFNGQLEFWNTKEMEMMASGEHFACTHVEWDPTGRYVTTSVSYMLYQLETGYQIWSFTGKPLYKHQQDKFFMFLWRPRPPTLLSKEQVAKIKKNLKQYSAEFSKQDEYRENKALRAVIERRRRLMDEWRAYREARTRDYEAVRGPLLTRWQRRWRWRRRRRLTRPAGLAWRRARAADARGAETDHRRGGARARVG